MIVTFDRVDRQIRHDRETEETWDSLAEEIFCTIANETWPEGGGEVSDMKQFWEDAKDRGQFEIKIVIDGKEMNPAFLERYYKNIDKHIKAEAQKLAYEKVREALEESQKLTEIVQDAGDKIIEKFGLDKEDYE